MSGASTEPELKMISAPRRSSTRIKGTSHHFFSWRRKRRNSLNNSHMLAGKVVLFLQFGFIVFLIYALSAEYQSNQFQQSWISVKASWLQYLLNGYLAAALIGVFIGGAFLLVGDIVRNRRRRGGLKTVV